MCNFVQRKHFLFFFSERKKEAETQERRKYPLEQRFKEVIVGQEGAINAVASGTIFIYFDETLGENASIAICKVFVRNLSKKFTDLQVVIKS